PKEVDPATTILDFLATVEPSRNQTLAPLAHQLAAGGEGLLIAVMTVPGADEAATLARSRQSFGGALALVLRPETWIGMNARQLAEADAHASGVTLLLERAGWRTATMTRTDRLDDHWQRLSARTGR